MVTANLRYGTDHFSTSDDTPVGSVISNGTRYFFSTRWFNQTTCEAKKAELLGIWLAANPEPDYRKLWEGAPKEVENGYMNQQYKIGEYPKFTDAYQAWWNERFGAIEAWKQATNFAQRAQTHEISRKTWEQAKKQELKRIDQVLATEFPYNDGPASVVVVKNEFNRNYADDPDCFDGNRWMTVAPASDWTPAIQ